MKKRFIRHGGVMFSSVILNFALQSSVKIGV